VGVKTVETHLFKMSFQLFAVEIKIRVLNWGNNEAWDLKLSKNFYEYFVHTFS